MKRPLALLVLLTALAAGGCGGDDGGEEAVDVDAFESCLEDGGLEVGRADEQLESLETQPVALFTLVDAINTEFGFPVPAQVAVFESADDAETAADSIQLTGGALGADRSGSVVWVHANVEGALSQEAETTIRDCAEDAG